MERITIRDETAGDEDAIRALHRLAFADEMVVRIVDDLHRSGDEVISLAACSPWT